MKIILFAPHFYPYKGGLEQYCWEIATRLAKLGQEIWVITARTGKAEAQEQTAGIKVVRLESWDLLGERWPVPKPNLKNWQLAKKAFISKPDRIITNTRFFPNALIGTTVAKIKKIPHFHIEHGTCYPRLESRLKRILAVFYDQIFGKIVMRSTNKVVAISGSAAQFAKKLGAEKVTVIPNSVDTEFFKPSKSKSQRKPLAIVFIGRLIEAKGIQDLIAIFKKLKIENLKLKIIGDGYYEKNLKKLARGNKNIEFLGEKTQKEIKKILAQSDILVNPSYSEGMPTAVLEAGVMELAVIATSVGGTKEIIQNGKNGYSIPAKKPKILQERLKNLIEDNRIRRKFGKNIRNTIVTKFSWQKNILKLLKEIQRCQR